MSDDQARDDIEEIVNDEPVQEAVIETIVAEEINPAKAKSKTKPKPKIKITKERIEPVEPIKEEPEPVIQEPPKNIKTSRRLIAQTAIYS